MSLFKAVAKPLVIAGPCSAESREQVLETAAAVKDVVQLFRAGVWKPRTRPGSFEGKGEEALAWLQEAKQIHGIKTTVEVAEPAHVELALKYGMDVLWIGAWKGGWLAFRRFLRCHALIKAIDISDACNKANTLLLPLINKGGAA